MMPQQSPHVLILGAGIGGLTLAQALRAKGLSFEIFERDNDAHERLQGWAIALHTMLDDFHASMPSDMPPFDMVNHLRPLNLPAEIAMWTPNSTQKWGGRDDGTGKLLRANRELLREWLSTKIDIQYGKRVVSVDEDENGVMIHFEDGSTASGDIAVGAEGVHSTTRKMLLKGRPDPLRTHRTGVIQASLTVSGELFAEQLSLGHSSYILDFENNTRRYHLFVGLDTVKPDGKSARYYWYIMWPDAEADRKDFWTITSTPEQLYAAAQDITSNLPGKFRKIIDYTGVDGIKLPSVRFYTLLLPSLPVGRVTLLGDSAHAMTPFRGEGGCHAMQDALNFARAVTTMNKNNLSSIKSGIESYQEEMLARGRKAAELSDKQFVGEISAETRVVAGLPIEQLPQEPIII